ncbi:MAG: hypothetical protein A2X36_15195 [Elusimicrobia bacterium GWA2_69_24]|nr:MAG: hypothetical protein A2X36_15195 [Elusimicrobia bacterium GWA2_69_24]
MKAGLITISLLVALPCGRCFGQGAAEKVLSLAGPLNYLPVVAFCPDGTRLLHTRSSGAAKAELCRLDGKGCAALDQGLKGDWAVAAWSPDGTLLAAVDRSVAGKGSVQLWSGTDLTPLGRFPVPFWPVRSAFSPDARLLAVADEYGRIEVFSVPDGKSIRSISFAVGSLGIHFQVDAGNDYPTVRQVLEGPAKKAGLKDWSRLVFVDGTSLYRRSYGDVYRSLMGEPGTEARLRVMPSTSEKSDQTKDYVLKRMPAYPGLGAIAFSPDSGSVVASFGDGCVRVWSVATGRLERTLGDGRIDSAHISGDGGTVLAMMEDGNLRVYSPDLAEPLRTLSLSREDREAWDHPYGSSLKGRFRLTNDGKAGVKKHRLADRRWVLRFFSTQDGEPVVPDIAAPDGEVIAFSPDGRFLALNASDRIDVCRNPASPHRFVREADAALTSATGKALTRLPAGTAVEVLGQATGHLYVRLAGGLKGYLPQGAVSVAKPDVMKPMVRLMESNFEEPVLRLKGVVYDDVKVASVVVAGTAVPRAAFAAEAGNYEDAYPFEARVRARNELSGAFRRHEIEPNSRREERA